MKRVSLIAGFSFLLFLGVAHNAEAGSRFVISVGIGAPAHMPYAYYGPYYPSYPVVYSPYYYYEPYCPAPVVTYYGRSYYGPRVYHRDYPRYGYVRGHVPPGRAYGRNVHRQYRRH